MIVGARDEVDAGPLQLGQISGVGARESAPGLSRRVFELVHQHFQVGKADVSVPKQLHEAHERLLAEDRKLAGNHGVPARHDGDVS